MTAQGNIFISDHVSTRTKPGLGAFARATQITLAVGPWPWRVYLEDGLEPHPNLARPEPGPELPCPCTQRDTGPVISPHPPANLHPLRSRTSSL